MLSLFVDRGVQDNTVSSKAEVSRVIQLSSSILIHSQIASALLDLIPIIDHAVSTMTSVVADTDTELIALFRSFWYLSILSGFVSPSRISESQRAALLRIAERTPCLLSGAGDDFAETELQFNAILKRSNHTLVRRLLSFIITKANR